MARKLKYKTVDELERAIDQYFESCEGEILKDGDGIPIYDKNGAPIYINSKPPTVTGLALFLGFSSRQSLINYQERKAFIDTVTRAKSRVEEYAETRLYDRDGQRGAEFNLKCNFGWKDKPETLNGGLETINDNIKSLKDFLTETAPNRRLPADE